MPKRKPAPKPSNRKLSLGTLLIYDHISPFGRGQPEAWQTARAILADAVEYWRAHDVPLAVLLRRAGRATPETAWL
jgi:hypothetical protein